MIAVLLLVPKTARFGRSGRDWTVVWMIAVRLGERRANQRSGEGHERGQTNGGLVQSHNFVPPEFLAWLERHVIEQAKCKL